MSDRLNIRHAMQDDIPVLLPLVQEDAVQEARLRVPALDMDGEPLADLGELADGSGCT